MIEIEVPPGASVRRESGSTLLDARSKGEPGTARTSNGLGLMLLPLAPDPGKAEGAKLELVAQTAKHGGFVALFESAGQVVRSLALLLIVDEVIGRVATLELAEGFGVHAGPEEGEVSDVPMAFATAIGVGRRLGFGDHRGHRLEPLTAAVTEPPDGVGRDEAGEQVRDVTDQPGIADPQLG
jgi:hypothetical protein